MNFGSLIIKFKVAFGLKSKYSWPNNVNNPVESVVLIIISPMTYALIVRFCTNWFPTLRIYTNTKEKYTS